MKLSLGSNQAMQPSAAELSRRSVESAFVGGATASQSRKEPSLIYCVKGSLPLSKAFSCGSLRWCLLCGVYNNNGAAVGSG